MKRILVLLLSVLAFGCNEEVTSSFTLSGSVKGLKKGTVYLQRYQDSMYVTLDSIQLNGVSTFELHSDITEPEVLFLRLDKNDNDEGIVPFFADKGITTVETTLKHFNLDAKVTGTPQQEVLDDYLTIMSKMNNQNLDLLKEKLEALKDSDSLELSSIDDYQNNFLKRKYLYTINFALNHTNSEVAPYLALYEVPNTSIRYLDSIYNSLETPIKSSLYGKKLKAYIDLRKESDTIN